jgi:hypothetical protein
VRPSLAAILQVTLYIFVFANIMSVFVFEILYEKLFALRMLTKWPLLETLENCA